MRKYLQLLFSASVLLALSASCCFSQPYWNEWISFSQKYYRIPVAANGMYRLNNADLLNAGIPSTIDSRTFQIFFRGQEQYIYVQDVNSNNLLDGNEYIEFYGQKNDGSLDSTLYKNVLYDQPVRQPNPYYSLFNDTSVYFLTWNTSTANHRIKDTSDTNFSVYQPTNYFMKEDVVENHADYYYGHSTATNINFPEYHEVEGWASLDFYPPSSTTTTFNTSNVFSGGPNATIKLAAMGASDDGGSSSDHDLLITYKDISGGFVTLDHPIFDGYRLYDSTFSVPATKLGAATGIVVNAQNVNATSRNAVPYVVLKYPHKTDLENKNYYEMLVPENQTQNKSNFSFTNFDDLGAPSYVYDLKNHLRIPLTKSGSTFKVLVPNAFNQSEKFCVVKSENQFLPVLSIKPVGANGTFTDYSALGIDSAFLIVTHAGLMPAALDYKSYRESIAGGSHHVLIADVSELYDQFGYGIPKYPFSIRHFAEYCLDTFPTPPQNLFLLGKAIQTNMARNSITDPSGINYAQLLVPSIGYPTCDNMLVAVLNGNVLAPAVPIGRLAAKNIAEADTYLNKVIEYEHPNPDPDEWMKHAIFMGGGANASQQIQFCAYLSGYESILADTSFGGIGHRFCKNSSSATQTSYTDSIKGLINSGVSLITFFGHTSASVFEFNLLPPDEYDNTNGKYPFFIADGCTAGDIHQPAQGGISASEIYTLSNKGTIGYLASSGPGTAVEMDLFTHYLYEDISKYLYGKSIGRCVQAAIDSIDGNASNIYINATCLEMTLHGDPSIVIHASKKPDYAVSSSSVYFTPSYVSTDMDSFNVHVILTNIGKATNDSVKVNLKRTFSDGTSLSYADTLPYLHFKDTMTFTLPVDPVHGPGLNKFELRVDSSDDVDELENILNNNLTGTSEIPLLIYSGDIIPVYPYKYAIVPNDTIMLKAYTANPFIASARYIFEIDTTDLYNSPLRKTQKVTQMGAVVKAPYNAWQQGNLVLLDSIVYFWRVRRDTIDTTFHWRESSFQYIPDKRGWGQSHFFQFLKGDKFRYIDTIRTKRYFALGNQNHSISVNTLNRAIWTAIGNESNMFIDGNHKIHLGAWISAGTPHLIVVPVDPLSGDVWYNDGTGIYGSLSGHSTQPNKDEGFEFFTDTKAHQDTLAYFLNTVVPCGTKIVMYTTGNHNLGDIIGIAGANVNPNLVQAFQSVGGTQFSSIQNDRPYIIIGRKCGAANEGSGAADSSKIFLGEDTFAVKRESGFIYSEVAGPASKWKSLHWKYHSPEDISNPVLAAQDTIKITVMGIKSNGGIDTLIKNISKASLDIYNLDSTIDAATYPYLQLQAWVKDSALRTPAQLNYWRLYYDGVPDAALNPVKGFTFYSPTVQQGDSMNMSVAIENIGDYDMDSLWVNFFLYDANRNLVPLDSIKMDSLLIDSILIPQVKFSTLNLPGGLSSLWVEANPFNGQHQLEQYHFNNIGTIPFMLNVDKINPLMDVTFDGVHIMNGDLVAAKPLITVRLKDENTFLALNDTADFDVFLKYPSKNTYDRIYFGNKMTFDPASLPNNSCRINYTPALADGKYELKVQASDRSGNNSGNIEYKIEFEVINKPTITSVLNYPNPFSTSTRFVFTLTGQEVPDYFKIQILTVTGKIVRDLNKWDLGPLHIGRNITEYAWDGKDQFGDQLANGLYLYRVITQLDGKALEHRDTDADPYFTQGYGKMYLIR